MRKMRRPSSNARRMNYSSVSNRKSLPISRSKRRSMWMAAGMRDRSMRPMRSMAKASTTFQMEMSTLETSSKTRWKGRAPIAFRKERSILAA